MKKQTLTAFALLAITLLGITSCSGIIGEETVVQMSFKNPAAGSSNARYIAPSANMGTIDVLEKGKKYTSGNAVPIIHQEFRNNSTTTIRGLFPGTYIFLIRLYYTEETANGPFTKNVGFALKEVTVEKGLNAVAVDMGPGITKLRISTGIMTNIENIFDPKGYAISYEQDSISIDISPFNSGWNIYLTYTDSSELDGGWQSSPKGEHTFESEEFPSGSGKTYSLKVTLNEP